MRARPAHLYPKQPLEMPRAAAKVRKAKRLKPRDLPDWLNFAVAAVARVRPSSTYCVCSCTMAITGPPVSPVLTPTRKPLTGSRNARSTAIDW
jgi:hypothetical protein